MTLHSTKLDFGDYLQIDFGIVSWIRTEICAFRWKIVGEFGDQALGSGPGQMLRICVRIEISFQSKCEGTGPEERG